MASENEQRAIVDGLRYAFQNKPLAGIRQTQIQANTRTPVRGGVWIGQDTFSKPVDDGLKHAVYDIIEANKSDQMGIPPRESVSLASVPCEWIGQRKGAGPKDMQPDIPDKEIYDNICKDVDQSMTIVYAHGGAFYWGSPAFNRGTTTKIAKMSKARVVSTSYRLAPQDPFPAALLDFFTAWMSLLYPSDDAHHEPIPPESVVLAGDSAGGNLIFAMIQAILQMRTVRKDGTKVLFNGKMREICLPAGIALLSPVADFALVFPSWEANGHVDILTPKQPALSDRQPSDDIWPSNPPRGDPYCEPSAWPHVLISPASAASWQGSPPMWLAVGEERCADAAKTIAARAAQQGVPVVLSQYMGLPHIFATLLKMLPQTQRCFQGWVDFCEACTSRGKITTEGEEIYMPGERVERFDVAGLSILPRDEILKRMVAATVSRKPWLGSTLKL